MFTHEMSRDQARVLDMLGDEGIASKLRDDWARKLLMFTPSVRTFCSHLLFTPSVHTSRRRASRT